MQFSRKGLISCSFISYSKVAAAAWGEFFWLLPAAFKHCSPQLHREVLPGWQVNSGLVRAQVFNIEITSYAHSIYTLDA